MESQNTVIRKSPYHKKYRILTEHEIEVLESIRKWKGVRHQAASELGMTDRAVIALLSRVRLKLEGASKARKKYGSILRRQR